MKWRKETQAYMWAYYYSEDGKWKAYDTDIVIKGGSRKKWYNPTTKKMENEDSCKHVWYLENLHTGEKFGEFKTLKQAKEYAETISEQEGR